MNYIKINIATTKSDIRFMHMLIFFMYTIRVSTNKNKSKSRLKKTRTVFVLKIKILGMTLLLFNELFA